MSLKDDTKKVNDLFSSKRTANQKSWGVIHDFYHIILNVMEEKKIKRTDLAKRLDVSRAAVTQMLNESPNISVRRMVEIADAIGVELKISSKDRDWFSAHATMQSGENKYSLNMKVCLEDKKGVTPKLDRDAQYYMVVDKASSTLITIPVNLKTVHTMSGYDNTLEECQRWMN